MHTTNGYHNITEMLWSDELQGLLRICGAQEREIGDVASDYEKLCALARSMPLLKGHPITARVTAILRDCFAITKPLSADTCEEIWRVSGEALLQNPISQITLATDGDVSLPTAEDLFQRFKQSSAFSALLFARTRAKSLDVWMREIESMLYDAVRSGCKMLFFGLPEAFEDRKPSIYHVNMTLHRGVQGKGDLDLLYAQLVRILAQVCQKYELALLLRVECHPDEVINLLSRVEREVGLPHIIWSTPRTDTRDELLHFSAKSHENSVFAAVFRADYQTDDDFIKALAEWARVYPIGQLIEVGE